MRTFRLVLFIFLLLPAAGRADSFRDEAWPLLQQLNASLVRFQDANPESPDCGGLWCPACGCYHSRAAEALWPLAYEAARTGSFERRSQALALARWLLDRQEADGAWTESEAGWKGTTTDQLYALTLSYPLLRSSLSRRERRAWRRSIRRAADFLCGVMDNDYAYINYCATSAASLAEAGRLLHRRRYLRKARSLARFCVSQFNGDGLLEGEGENEGGRKRGVDIGYNLDMSLWGLVRYAQLCRDRVVREQVSRSARAHTWFIYPDGTLDGTVGLRSSKWAVWGSATADGCAPLWIQLAAEDPRYEALAVRNLRKTRACLSESGLLAPGPDYDAIRDTLPCLYHTFATAGSLAMALDWAPAQALGDAVGRDPEDTLVHFPTLQTAIVRRGPFQGTVCAYGYRARKADSKFMQRPTGGAMTLLWAEGFGLVQAASQTRYRRWEESFPWMPEVLPLTPRIETAREGVYYTNLYDFDAALQPGPDFSCAVSGALKDSLHNACGAAFRIRYEFSETALTKEYTVTGGPVRIVEPLLLAGDEAQIRCDGRTVRFERGGVLLLLTMESGTGRLQVDSATVRRYRQVYPALRAVPVVLDLPGPDATARIRFHLGEADPGGAIPD